MNTDLVSIFIDTQTPNKHFHYIENITLNRKSIAMFKASIIHSKHWKYLHRVVVLLYCLNTRYVNEKEEILWIKNSKIIESYPFLGLGIVSSTMYPISVNRILQGSCKQCMLNIVSILPYLKDANTVHYKRFYDKYISFTI